LRAPSKRRLSMQIRIAALTTAALLLGPLFCMGQDPGNPLNPSDSQYSDNFQVDSVNLQNLSIGISIPVRSKGGAIPISYSLQGNSSCARVPGGTVGQRNVECGINPNKRYGSNSPRQYPYSNWTLLGETDINNEFSSTSGWGA